MIRKVLTKATVGAFAATAFVAVGPATVVATDIAPAACTYPASVTTATSMKIARHRVHLGQRVRLRAVVLANVGTPKGHVKFVVKRRYHGHKVMLRKKKWLRSGTAHIHHAFPRGWYKVKVKYLPKTCSKWLASKGPTRHFKVVR